MRKRWWRFYFSRLRVELWLTYSKLPYWHLISSHVQKMLLVWRHLPAITVVKRLIQGRNITTRVQLSYSWRLSSKDTIKNADLGARTCLLKILLFIPQNFIQKSKHSMWNIFLDKKCKYCLCQYFYMLQRFFHFYPIKKNLNRPII